MSEIFTDEPLVGKHEVLESLSICDSTLNAWARTYSDFPVVKLPGANRYRLSDVSRWLQTFNPRRKAEMDNKKEAALAGAASAKNDFQSNRQIESKSEENTPQEQAEEIPQTTGPGIYTARVITYPYVRDNRRIQVVLELSDPDFGVCAHLE
jgi:hypothetical protein